MDLLFEVVELLLLFEDPREVLHTVFLHRIPLLLGITVAPDKGVIFFNLIIFLEYFKGSPPLYMVAPSVP